MHDGERHRTLMRRHKARAWSMGCNPASEFCQRGGIHQVAFVENDEMRVCKLSRDGVREIRIGGLLPHVAGIERASRRHRAQSLTAT